MTEFPSRDTPGGALLTLRLIPRARRTELAGQRGGALLVRLQAPPVDGAANTALVEALAGWLGIPKRQVTIVSGERSRDKVVRIDGLSVDAVRTRLAPAD